MSISADGRGGPFLVGLRTITIKEMLSRLCAGIPTHSLCGLSEQFLNHIPSHIRQTERAALRRVGQSLVINTQ